MNGHTHAERPALSAIGRASAPNQIKSLIAPFVGVGDIAHLAQGAPPPSVFPITGLQLELADGNVVRVGAEVMAAAQQYQYARSGYTPLLEWCRDFTAKHHRERGEWEVALHAGGTDAIAKLIEVLCDPGDVVLCEAYTWSTALDGMRTHGVCLAGVEVDEAGMVPAALEREITRAEAAGQTIKALYIVPNGSNPCGTTLAPERFAQIYALCSAHGILVMEDDPYWWLGLGGAKEPLPGPATSFASIDTDARVVRIDSFAKCVAPGFRLGWLSGPPRIVHAFNAASSTSTHNGSPFAMAVLHALLAHWGEAGLHAHIESTRAEYRRRLGVVLGVAEKQLAGLADWSTPKAGMFLFLDLSPSGVQESTKLMPKLREYRVLTIPSAVFSPSGTPSPHMRISFSQASDDDIVKGVSRLADLLREHKSAPSTVGAGS